MKIDVKSMWPLSVSFKTMLDDLGIENEGDDESVSYPTINTAIF